MIIKTSFKDDSTNKYRTGTVLSAIANKVLDLQLGDILTITAVINMDDKELAVAQIRTTLNKIAADNSIKFATKVRSDGLLVRRVL